MHKLEPHSGYQTPSDQCSKNAQEHIQQAQQAFQLRQQRITKFSKKNYSNKQSQVQDQTIQESRIENEQQENDDSYFQKLQEDLEVLDSQLKKQEFEELQFKMQQQKEIQHIKQMNQQNQSNYQEQTSITKNNVIPKQIGKQTFQENFRPNSFSNLQSVINPKQILEKKNSKLDKDIKMKNYNNQSYEKPDIQRSLSCKKKLPRQGQRNLQHKNRQRNQNKINQTIRQNNIQKGKPQRYPESQDSDIVRNLLQQDIQIEKNQTQNGQQMSKAFTSSIQKNSNSNCRQNDKQENKIQVLSTSLEDHQIKTPDQQDLLHNTNIQNENLKSEKDTESFNYEQVSEFNSFNIDEVIRNQQNISNQQIQEQLQIKSPKHSYLQMFKKQSNDKTNVKSPSQKKMMLKHCSPVRKIQQMLYSPQFSKSKHIATFSSNRQSPKPNSRNKSPIESPYENQSNQRREKSPQQKQVKELENLIASLHEQLQEAKQAKLSAQNQLKKAQEDFLLQVQAFQKQLEDKEKQNQELISQMKHIYQGFEVQKQEMVQKAYKHFEQSMQNVVVEDIEILKNQNQAYETQIKILQENCKSIEQQ